MLLAKAVAVEVKVNAEKRLIEGYASTFNNIDHGSDRVLPGAYTKTLVQDLPAGRIKVKRNHETLIGRPHHAEQDSKGLLTVSRISKTPIGDETLILAEDGVIDRMSIGYVPEQKSVETVDGRKVRNLEVVRLTEWSFLDEAPMNDNAIITGVKGMMGVEVKDLYDVSLVLDQMSEALRHLRALTWTPPEIATRLRALIAEISSIPPEAPVAPSDQAVRIAALNELLGEFTQSLSTL